MRLRDDDDTKSTRARSLCARPGRAIAVTLLAAVAGLGHAQGAMAVTAQEQFLAAVGKIAPFAPTKAKRFCRCTRSTDTFVDVGVGELRTIIVSSNGGEDYGVVCAVPTFDASTGAALSTRPCTNHQFEILPK